MKALKILFLSFSLCLGFNISALAQSIQNKFWGLTLGESTLNEVKNRLKSLDCPYEIDEDGMLSANRLKFMGEACSTVCFQFYDDKIAAISIVTSPMEKSEFKSKFNYIKNKIDSKYSNLTYDNTGENKIDLPVYIDPSVYTDNRNILVFGYSTINIPGIPENRMIAFTYINAYLSYLASLDGEQESTFEKDENDSDF